MAELQRRPAASDVLPPRVPTDSQKSREREGQLGLLHGYFTLQSYGGVLALAVLAISKLFGRGDIVPMPPHPWVSLPAFALGTWAAFRTRRLLGDREREGAWMAGAVFGCNLVTASAAGHLGFGVVVSALGVFFSVNVYRHLRDEDASLEESSVHALD